MPLLQFRGPEFYLLVFQNNLYLSTTKKSENQTMPMTTKRALRKQISFFFEFEFAYMLNFLNRNNILPST